MLIEPETLGFAWVNETILRNSFGMVVRIRPSHASAARLNSSAGNRSAECFRFYETIYGIVSELELKKWLAGGDAACFQLIGSVMSLLGLRSDKRMLRTEALHSLLDRGFSAIAVEINLGWLVNDGYIAAESAGGEPTLRLIRV